MLSPVTPAQPRRQFRCTQVPLLHRLFQAERKRLRFLAAIRSLLTEHCSVPHCLCTELHIPRGNAHQYGPFSSGLKMSFGSVSFIRRGRTYTTQSSAAEPCVCFSPGCHLGWFALGAFSLALAVSLDYKAPKYRTHMPSFHFSSTAGIRRQPLGRVRLCQTWRTVLDSLFAADLPKSASLAALFRACCLACPGCSHGPPGGHSAESPGRATTAEAHQCFYLLRILISPRDVWVKRTQRIFKSHVTVLQVLLFYVTWNSSV